VARIDYIVQNLNIYLFPKMQARLCCGCVTRRVRVRIVDLGRENFTGQQTTIPANALRPRIMFRLPTTTTR